MTLVLATMALFIAVPARVRAGQTVVSPGGNVQLAVDAAAAQLRFAISLNGTPVIEPSPLVFTLDGVDLTQGATVEDVKADKIDQTYPTRGVHSTAKNRCSTMRLSMKHTASGAPYALELRAFDDAAAFRFLVPAAGESPRIPDELTTFTVPAGSTVWSHNLRGHYEGTYERHDISELQPDTWHAPPVTLKLSNGAGYASITEANLVNYSGMALESDGKRGLRIGLAHRQPVSYPFELRYPKEDVERLSKPAAISGEIVTPWRVVLVGKDLNALVNSDAIASLNPPPDPQLFPQGVNTEWARPGRAVWRYLDNVTETRGDPGADPELARAQRDRAAATQAVASSTTQPATRRAPRAVPLDEIKHWSDLAGQLGFEYNVLEGFWRQWSDAQLRELVDYSRQRNVRLLVWVASRSLRDETKRRELFDMLHQVGVAGLKIDFFDHEHKEMIDLYHAILRDAAERRLVLDFHGANKPTGESRTWPNELVREAIRGMEARSLTARATHETTLPFTRFLAGHAEYTGLLFNQRRGDTTAAHQIAVPIVFTAELNTFGANPENILKSPAVELIKSIPATWDETRVLPPSEIGELAVFARRKGETWFLAVLNGTEPRSIKVPLNFLGDGERRAMVVTDAKPQATTTQPTDQIEVKRDQRFTADQTITIDLPAGGGYVARFTRN
jgi:alpha-glucosidase